MCPKGERNVQPITRRSFIKGAAAAGVALDLPSATVFAGGGGGAAWKDVTIVPPGGKVRLLMPVMDYAGMAMLHCHIIDHEDIGMMGVWHIMGEPMPMDLRP